MNICNICKGHDIHFDSTRGENVCGDCGHVLEGNGIVSQVFFLIRHLLIYLNKG